LPFSRCDRLLGTIPRKTLRASSGETVKTGGLCGAGRHNGGGGDVAPSCDFPPNRADTPAR